MPLLLGGSRAIPPANGGIIAFFFPVSVFADIKGLRVRLEWVAFRSEEALACDSKSKTMATPTKITLAVCFLALSAYPAKALCPQGSTLIQNGDGLITAINGLLSGTGSGELCVNSDLSFDSLIEFGTVLPLIKGINITIVGDCSDYCYITALNGLSFMAASGMETTVDSTSS